MNAVSLTSVFAMSEAMLHARRIELESYVLKNPLVLYALETAARRGSDVRVLLGDPPQGKQRADNVSAMRDLRRSGAHVSVASYGSQPLHGKIAVVDDCVFLDDRNFTKDVGETVLRVRRPQAVQQLAHTKAESLAEEARLIREGAGDTILFSTEALGAGPVANALIERAARGDHVRVMRNSDDDERDTAEVLERMRAAGVAVRDSGANHKIAVVGERAWIGSANASPGADDTLEWGMTVPAGVSAQLRDDLEYCWATAKA